MNGISLRLRLLLIGGAAIILSLGAAAAALSILFGHHVERRAAAELQLQLEQVVAGLAREPTGLSIRMPPVDPRFSRPYGGLYWQVKTDEQTLRSRSLWDQTLEFASDDQVPIQKITGPEGASLLALHRTVRLPARLGGAAAQVIVAMDRSELTVARRAFVADMAPYLGALALALIAAQIAQLVYGLRPLIRIRERIGQLRAGRASRMGAEWPSEMLPLANEIDALLEARETDIKRARLRAGDLAHGLKTPLQALLGETQYLHQNGEARIASSIEDIVDTMRSHVERELARARTATTSSSSCDVASSVERINAVLSRTPNGRSLIWNVHAETNLSATIDAADLAEALGALVENAVRHARSAIFIEVTKHDQRIKILIGDDGGGVPPERLTEIARRGCRLDEQLPGDGLGIAIATEIIEGAKGTLKLQNGTKGLMATIELPLSTPKN